MFECACTNLLPFSISKLFLLGDICREELDLFSREVIRFGDLCKDPQWHNLGRYFSRWVQFVILSGRLYLLIDAHFSI